MRKAAQLSAWITGLALCAGVSLAADSTAGRIELEAVDQRISLDASEVDLHLLLQRIADETGVRLWLSERLPSQNVTIRVDDLPLPALLERLLRQQSYALVVDDEKKRVTGLFVLPPGEAPPARAELSPGPYRDQASVLVDALASPQIPDNIKLAMMVQYNGNQAARDEIANMTRIDLMTRLVEQIERNQSASPETVRRLREKLERMKQDQE